MDRLPTRTFPYPGRTLPEILKRQAARCGDKLPTASPSRPLSHADAPGIAARCAGRLAATGIKAGDRVVAFTSNNTDFIELWFGAVWRRLPPGNPVQPGN